MIYELVSKRGIPVEEDIDSLNEDLESFTEFCTSVMGLAGL
jgi:hypothetical protein